MLAELEYDFQMGLFLWQISMSLKVIFDIFCAASTGFEILTFRISELEKVAQRQVLL